MKLFSLMFFDNKETFNISDGICPENQKLHTFLIPSRISTLEKECRFFDFELVCYNGTIEVVRLVMIVNYTYSYIVGSIIINLM